MISKVFSVLVGVSFTLALLCGRMQELSNAITSGAQEAVNISVATLGMTCLWKGIIAVFENVGVVETISRLTRPALRLIYPTAFSISCGDEEICTHFAANLLGLGNAALPSGLCVMEKLSKDPILKNDMITFSVLATVPIQLIPTTLITLRSAAGSQQAYSIVLPILLNCVATYIFGVILCRIYAYIYERKKR